MKWWRVYLGIFTLETLILLVFNLATGSAASEQIILNLSLNRLILVVVLVVLLAAASWLFRSTVKDKKRTLNFLNDSLKIFTAVVLSFLALALDLYLLSRDRASWGDFTQVYLNFKPFLVWGFAVSLQTWWFALTWFGYRFAGESRNEDPEKSSSELLAVLGIFLLVVVSKIALVLPSAYGPVIRGDEMRYFEMAKHLYQGSFFIENINHSPYLYPLMLSPAFAFGKHTYEAIKLLNVLYSSSIIFPLFLISRKYFSKKNALLVVGVACVIPYQFLFPRVIMSENLYFPILLWVIFVVLNQPRFVKLTLPWAIFSGIIIGLLYMTRYITLALIPFLLIAWWLIFPDDSRGLFHPSRRKLLAALLLGIGIILGYSFWLFSGINAGVPVKTLLGFGITADTTASQLTSGNLMIWFAIYLCYYILMVSPVLPLFFIFPLARFKMWKKETRDWYILTAALMVGFLAACVRHSWRALYNGDLPTRIMGRYILYFTPLFIIAALLAVKETPAARRPPLGQHLLTSLALPFILVVGAHRVLFGNLFRFHDGDLINILGSVDAAYFQYLGIFFFILLLLIYGMISYLTWRKNYTALASASLAAIILFFLAGMPTYYRDLLSYQRYQYVGSKIVELCRAPQRSISDKIVIFTPPDATERDRALLSNTLHFYGFEDLYVDRIENFNINKIPEEKPDTQSVTIVIINEKHDQLDFPARLPRKFGGDYFMILY